MENHMKRIHWLTWVAIGLWLATVLYNGYFFIFGTTTKKAADKRITIVLSSGDREFVLNEMRSMLIGLRNIVSGLSTDNMKEVSKALSSMGMKTAPHESRTLHKSLPIGFKLMGRSLHKKMDALSLQISLKKISKKQFLTELSNALGTCVSCHATSKIATKPNPKKK
jgi:cytochrome c553